MKNSCFNLKKKLINTLKCFYFEILHQGDLNHHQYLFFNLNPFNRFVRQIPVQIFPKRMSNNFWMGQRSGLLSVEARLAYSWLCLPDSCDRVILEREKRNVQFRFLRISALFSALWARRRSNGIGKFRSKGMKTMCED